MCRLSCVYYESVCILRGPSGRTDLEVSQLRERLSTAWCFAVEWLCAGVSTNVNLEMRLLVEALVAVGNGALVSLSWLLGSLDCFFLLKISMEMLQTSMNVCTYLWL